MFLNANGPGVEKVMKPTKYANMLNPTPFARIVMGKISAHQTKDGASMNWKSTIKRYMKATQAMLPALLSVPR